MMDGLLTQGKLDSPSAKTGGVLHVTCSAPPRSSQHLGTSWGKLVERCAFCSVDEEVNVTITNAHVPHFFFFFLAFDLDLAF